MPALTADLAKFVATIDPGAVPERATFGARIGMLDCVGTMIAGADEEAVSSSRRSCRPTPATTARRKSRAGVISRPAMPRW